MEGSANMFTGLEPVLDIFFCYISCVCSLMFIHNILRQHLHVMDFVIISHVGAGNNFSHLPIYYAGVMF
jgi:hypothetical protein